MRHASRAILAGALGFAAAFVVACGGGSGLLSGGQASTLTNQLNSVSSALVSKNCVDVSGATGKLANDVINLPSSVNSTLRNNLTQGVSTISQLARRQCANVPSPQTTQTDTTTTATTTTTQTHTATTPTTPTNTNTNTTTTTTTPTSPTSTTTTPATTSTPSGTTSTGTGGAGFGQGNGNSSGGSGTGGDGNAP